MARWSAGEITEAVGKLPERKTVSVRTERVAKLLGVTIDEKRIESILSALGLQPQKISDGLQATSPSFRYDIEIEADLIEEIARVYGYENIPETARWCH